MRVELALLAIGGAALAYCVRKSAPQFPNRVVLASTWGLTAAAMVAAAFWWHSVGSD